MSFFADYPPPEASGGVTSLNGLSGALTLTAGSGISITPSGNSLTIAATGGGAGANTALSNLVSTAVNQSLIPGVMDGSLGLGTVANYWGPSQISVLNDTPGNPAIDLSNGHRRLINGSGNIIVDWGTIGVINDNAGNTFINLGSHEILRASTVVANFNTLLLNNQDGQLVMNWQQQNLYDPTSSQVSVDWGDRLLIDSNGATQLGWSPSGVSINTALTLNGATSGSVVIEPYTITSPYTLVLPAAQGAASTVLTNDGSGNLSWAAASSGPIVNTFTTTTGAPTQTLLYTMSPGETIEISTTLAAKATAGATPVAAVATGSIDGVTTSVTITASTPGNAGNPVMTQIWYDGVMTINAAIAAWNSNFPYNQVSLTSGSGTQVPYAVGTYASYTGTPTGCSTPVTITSAFAGSIATVTLIGDGTSTISQLISNWNALIFGTVSYAKFLVLTSGDGTQVPSYMASIPLSAGTNGGFSQTFANNGSGFSAQDSAQWANFTGAIQGYVDVGGIAVSTSTTPQNGLISGPNNYTSNGFNWLAGYYVTNMDNSIYLLTYGQDGFTIDWKAVTTITSVV